LILGKRSQDAFFATLALKLKIEMNEAIPTAGTDGKRLVVNPQFWLGLSEQERIGVVAHEIMHNALGHQGRRDSRDAAVFNEAADLSINPMLLADGFVLPKEGLFPGKGKYKDLPEGLSAEEYYTRLMQKKPSKDPNGDGEGEGGFEGPPDPNGQPGKCPDPGKCGGVIDNPGTLVERQQDVADWQVAVAQAAQVARQKGNLPGGLERLVGEIVRPKVNWTEVLREFVRKMSNNDFSWSHPNKRYLPSGIYLPGMRSEEIGDIVVAIDTSGSIDQGMIDKFSAEVQGILEAYDCKAHVIYCDAKVHRVDEWTRNDGDFRAAPVGGGGTDHKPVFDCVQEKEIDPACMICLTDLYTSFPDEAPPYPVLWAVYGNPSGKAPFGQVMPVE
jgi:predicted metal-dependent peptidase